MSYYRIQPASYDTTQLLDPELQYSESYCTGTVRHGVSVCDSPEELATYLAHSGIPFDDTFAVIELEGSDSDEDDEDAHQGARLIIPTSIISATPITDTLLDLINAAYDTTEEEDAA